MIIKTKKKKLKVLASSHQGSSTRSKKQTRNKAIDSDENKSREHF